MPASAADRVGEACPRIRERAPRSFDARRGAGVLTDVRQAAEFRAGETAGTNGVPGGVPGLQRGAHRPRANAGSAGPALPAAATGVVSPHRRTHRPGHPCPAAMGFTEAAWIAGGAAGWTAAGRPRNMR